MCSITVNGFNVTPLACARSHVCHLNKVFLGMGLPPIRAQCSALLAQVNDLLLTLYEEHAKGMVSSCRQRDEASSQHHASTALTLEKTRYPLYRRLGEPRGRSEWHGKKYRLPQGFDPPDRPESSMSLTGYHGRVQGTR